MRIFIVFLIVFSVASANEALQEIVKANNLFTPNVYKEITLIKNENFMVSPFSAEIILALTQSGCKGETAEEIRNVLHLPNSKEKIEDGIKALLPTIKGNNIYTLQTANKIYIKKNFQIRETFKKVSVEVYYADIENIDFAKNKEAAKTMNDWVEQKTENKIKDLINPNDLDDDTRAILINALYMKGKWSKLFDLSNTYKRKFYKNAKDTVEVEMMHHYSEYFNYYECSHLNAKFLELPFVGEDASMIIILPNEKEGLSSLEQQIDRVFIPHNLTWERVNVAIPKFKIESTIDLKQLLKNMGVRKAFNSKKADISGIAGEKGDLVIDQIVQKTFVDVSEKGVEAAAATFVQINRGDSGYEPDPVVPKEFIADHPFIFYIKIKNIIAFAGRVKLL